MKKKILLVEDEHYTSYSIKLVLKLTGYDVDVAKDGLEAFQMVLEAMEKARPFDLIVSDIKMPNMTGLDFIDKLKQAKVTIPILAVTGYGNKDMVVELMRKGCSDYLDKPFEPEELIRHVNVLI